MIPSSFSYSPGQGFWSLIKSWHSGTPPSSPVVKMLHFQCRRHGSTPVRGTKIPHAAQRHQKIGEKKTKQKLTNTPSFHHLKLKWSCWVVSNSFRSHGLQPTRLLHPWNVPGKSTGVGCHFLLQGIFLTWGSNPGLPHCGQMLYPQSHMGSPVFTMAFPVSDHLAVSLSSQFME